MFADPQTITVNAVAKVMARILIDGKKCTYQNPDGTFSLTISHQNLTNDRIRSMARVDSLAIVPDPLTAVNDYETLTYYSVLDRPKAGFSVTQVDQLIVGYETWLDSAAIAKIYGQEA